MKFIIALLLTGLLSFAGALFLPWWIIAVAAFIVGLVVSQPPFLSFCAAFLALFVLWGVHAFYIDSQNGHILSGRVASLLPLGGSWVALILITGAIAGLVAGLAALSASFLHKKVDEQGKQALIK